MATNTRYLAVQNEALMLGGLSPCRLLVLPLLVLLPATLDEEPSEADTKDDGAVINGAAP